MYSKVLSGVALGIDGMLISVETDISAGLPGLSLVGYLASSVKEAGERVRAAMKNIGYFLPSMKITVNLSPADVRKDGTNYDLAIAIGILLSMGIIPESDVLKKQIGETAFLGELGLDGSIIRINGVLPIVDYAKKQGIKRVVLPKGNASEAAYVKGIEIIPIDHLKELMERLLYGCWPDNYTRDLIEKVPVANKDNYPDLADVKGQEFMKRGLVIAVAGFHNMMMTGAAGSGKSMIAKCIPGIMPELSYAEQMELTKIYSVAKLLSSEDELMKRRPFRSPGQSITEIALCGGGVDSKPGEISLANNGVLFLDEFPEFKRNVIESLRQPMEDRQITVSRLKGSYTYPAKFMLVSARNNCPCGFYPDRKKCRCTSGEIYRYQNRISHPIMDRIDIRIEVRPVEMDDLLSAGQGMSSEQARALICRARKRQEKRYINESFNYNAEIPQNKISEYIVLDSGMKERLREIFETSSMSARSYYKMLRLMRTIADIDDREEIIYSDIEEALFFRNETDMKGGVLC